MRPTGTDMVTLNKDKCKACGYCVKACPKTALVLSNQLNANGYGAVSIDQEKCISCGTCYVVCPDCVFSVKG
jgi:2-oxoglutarate ferredoxin oxidoreductase subunit delta